MKYPLKENELGYVRKWTKYSAYFQPVDRTIKTPTTEYRIMKYNEFITEYPYTIYPNGSHVVWRVNNKKAQF